MCCGLMPWWRSSVLTAFRAWRRASMSAPNSSVIGALPDPSQQLAGCGDLDYPASAGGARGLIVDLPLRPISKLNATRLAYRGDQRSQLIVLHDLDYALLPGLR